MRSKDMKGQTADRARDMLFALTDGLELDPAELGRAGLNVWRERSPELVIQCAKRGEDPVANAAAFFEALVGSLGPDADLDWNDREQGSRDYARRCARQAVPLPSLIDELAVYRRVTIELISTRLQWSPDRDGIVALAQSRLEDVTDRLNQTIVSGYLDGAGGGHRPTSHLATKVGAVVGLSSYLAQTASRRLTENMFAFGLGAPARCLTAKVARFGEAALHVAQSAHNGKASGPGAKGLRLTVAVCRSGS